MDFVFVLIVAQLSYNNFEHRSHKVSNNFPLNESMGESINQWRGVREWEKQSIEYVCYHKVQEQFAEKRVIVGVDFLVQLFEECFVSV